MANKRASLAILLALACPAVLVATLAAPPDVVAQPAVIDPARAEEIALDHLQGNRRTLGLAPPDIADVIVTDVVASRGATAVHLQQRIRGVDVAGGVMNVVVDDAGSVVDVGNRFVPGIAKLTGSVAPNTTAAQAAEAAVDALSLRAVDPASSSRPDNPGRRQRVVTADGVVDGEIPARLVVTPADDGSSRLAWEVTVDAIETEEVWKVVVDAQTGQEIERSNLVRADSYRVFEHPVEAPTFGTRTLVVDPADPTASPFGWHDTDGIAGADTTITQGNNVTAYLDVDSDQQPDPGSQPDGGASLVFDHALDLSKEPVDSQDAAVTNLFYWTNRLHDILYGLGFDEAAGNFQTNNYGAGGLGGDAVRAETQDGFLTNNANFFTPADGSPPRMQLYLFTHTTPNRDSGLDNGLIAHEYAHGLTDRLTGGPSNVTCLGNDEQAGEGWSDFFAMMLTMQPGDQGSDGRGFGSYLLGQPTGGLGLRSHRYSTDMAVDPRTYSWINGADIPHGVGSVFAAMLWEMAWAFIERDGFDADMANGTGGNNTAMRLVVDGLKLQPCDPGFVDARDAILLADQNSTGGADRCLIWEAFAKRGLGFSASQGDPDNITDGVEAFDVPADCADLTLTVTPSPAPVEPGAVLSYDVGLTNNAGSPLTGVTVTATIPQGAAYVPASADCGGSEAGGVVTLVAGTIAAGSSVGCTFAVTVDVGPGTTVLLADAFESGAGAWTTTHGAGSLDWAITSADANSPLNSIKADNLAQVSDQYLTTAAPVPISAGSELRFWHRFSTENTWDGGVVEVSTDGSAWTDLGPWLDGAGYRDLLRVSGNPLAGRLAFTGDSGGWVQTTADLSNWAGSSLYLRFRFGSDATQGEDGWYIDDVEIADAVELTSTATAVSAEGPNDARVVTTTVVSSGFLRVTTDPAVPAVIDVNGSWTDAFGLDWVQQPPADYDVCFSDVPGFTTPACQTATVVSGSTTAVQGSFVTHGTLNVVTSPPVVSTITVGGEPVNDWGAIVSIEPGNHELCFGAVEGFDPPPCETVVVSAGAITSVTGVFTANGAATGPSGFGNLRVTTSPAVPSQFVIDGQRTVSFGLDWVKLSPGTYELCFTDVPGFESPACEMVTVVAGATTVVQGVFTPLAELRVLTSPPANQPVTVDGRIVDQYGFWSWVPGGVEYEICTAGYVCQLVTPPAGAPTTVTLVPGP